MTRRRVARLALAALACLTALCGLLSIGLSSGLFQEQLRARAERFLQQASGRPVRIERLTFRLRDGALELAGLRVGQAGTGGGGPPLFAADAVRIAWRWRPLLARRIVLDEIRFTRPQLALSFAATEASPEATPDLSGWLFPLRILPASGWELSLPRVWLQEGTVAWTQPDGRKGRLDRLQGELGWAAGGGALQFSLEASRVAFPLGPDTQSLERPRLRVEATPQTVTIGEISGLLYGFPLKIAGRVSNLAETPRLDLKATGQMTLADIAHLAKSPGAPEGTLALTARIQGDWTNPVATGEGILQFGPAAAGTALPLRFRWADGRIRAETAEGGRAAGEAADLRLELAPATRDFQAWLKVGGLDLRAVRGVPATLATLAGITVPPEARGRLTASLDLTGQGTDLAVLRGQGALTVDGFAWGEDSPVGRLSARFQATADRLAFTGLALSLPGGEIQGRATIVPKTGAVDAPIRLEVQDAAQFARAFGVGGTGGTGRLAGRISGTREAPRFQGRLVWRKPRLADFALDQLEGEIALAGRTLTVSGLVLRLGQTSATVRGTLAATGATPIRRLSPKQDLVTDLFYDLRGRTADLARFLPTGLRISGTGRASGRLRGPIAALAGEATLALQRLETWGETWQKGEGILRFQPGSWQVSAIALLRGKERVTGEIAAAPDGKLQARLSSTPMDVSRISWLSALDLAGHAAFQVDLQEAGQGLRIRGAATAESLSFRKLDIGPSTATFTAGPDATDVRLEFRDGTHRLHLLTTPRPNPTLQAELTLQRAALDLLLEAVQAPVPAGAEAQGDGVIRFRGPLGNLAGGAAVAEFRRLQVRLANDLLESSGPILLRWRDNTLTVQPARFRVRGGELQVQGTVGGGGQGDLRIGGQLPLAAFASFVPTLRIIDGSAGLDLQVRGPLASPEVEGEIAVANGTLALPRVAVPLSKLSTRLKLDGDSVQTARWEGVLAGGSASGSAEVRRQADSWRFAVEYAIREARAERFYGPAASQSGALTGALSAAGRLSGSGQDEAELRRSLQGDLRLELHDGRIGRYTLLAKILALTNIARLFDSSALELGGKGMPFRRVTGDFRITDGVARSENLLLESSAMRVSAVGQVNVGDETLDVTAAIRPFQTVDAALSWIPIAGWLLQGKEGAIVVAYARATGPIRDPKVEALPLKSVGRTLFGTFLNLLDLPKLLTGESASPAPTPGEESGGASGARP